jgi:WhiB family redox-sensing transcriptional regulator
MLRRFTFALSRRAKRWPRSLSPVEPELVQWLMVQDTEDLTTVAELFGRPEWQRYGACRGQVIETFVPNKGGNFTTAREICQRCAVRQECLDFAMADEDLAGMWGGTTAPERRAMRAKRGVA